MRKLLINLLKKIGLRFKKRSFEDAVKRAEILHQKTGQKCLVFLSKGEFKVVTKQMIRDGKKRGFFRGMEYRDVERRALYTAPNYMRVT